jgi:SAM-dependent methyltransferase
LWGVKRALGKMQAALDQNLDPIRTISPNDAMWQAAPSVYFQLGAKALDCIWLAMAPTSQETFESILDFGCGHGRVLRFLKEAWPSARLAACDLDSDGVGFCAETFSATPIYSDPDPSQIDLGEATYDLIWCGSVFTHLDAPQWNPLLERFTEILRPQGFLVFTTAGRSVVDEMRRGETIRWFPTERLGDFDSTGFSYAPYPDLSGLGQSLCSIGWALDQLRQLPLRVLSASENAWGGQDVVACQFT